MATKFSTCCLFLVCKSRSWSSLSRMAACGCFEGENVTKFPLSFEMANKNSLFEHFQTTPTLQSKSQECVQLQNYSLQSRRILTKTRRYIDRGRHLEKRRKRLRGRGVKPIYLSLKNTFSLVPTLC